MLASLELDSINFARSSIRPLQHKGRFHEAITTAAFRSSTKTPQKDGSAHGQSNEQRSRQDQEAFGAMSRRLSEMTEDTMEQGGRAARKAMDEAGFSEELKKGLEAKIADSNFRSKNPAAFAQLDMPVYLSTYQSLDR